MIAGDKLVISDKLIILIVFFWKAPFSFLGTFDPSAVWRTGHKAGVQTAVPKRQMFSWHIEILRSFLAI